MSDALQHRERRSARLSEPLDRDWTPHETVRFVILASLAAWSLMIWGLIALF
jgi:hypothetical protein